MLFVDDTKLWRLIKSIYDVNILQEEKTKMRKMETSLECEEM